jgi:coproporphyrinogen III oxidase-like Fe-S oxidoreductase
VAGERPPREVEELPRRVRESERVLLGLRLDEPLAVTGMAGALDWAAVERLQRLGLVDRRGSTEEAELTLTRRGRFLGGGVTAELLA